MTTTISIVSTLYRITQEFNNYICDDLVLIFLYFFCNYSNVTELFLTFHVLPVMAMCIIHYIILYYIILYYIILYYIILYYIILYYIILYYKI